MSPTLRGRIDIEKYNKGLQECENFIPTVQGPLKYREGTQYVLNEADGVVILVEFTINNRNRFLLSLSENVLKIYDASQSLLLKTLTTPYLEEEIRDLRYSYESGSMVFTHPLHPPQILTIDLEASIFSDSYAIFEPLKFTSHPFQKIDNSNTVLSISNEAERVRLVSDENEWGSLSTVDLAANEHYTEYKVGNQWGLARVMEYISAKEVLVDPVSSVVNIEDPSVRLALFDNDDGSTGDNDAWLKRDGVPTGKVHVRADTLIFRTSHLGAWVRIGGSTLFTNVCDPVNSAAFNSQDDKVRWAKITDYRGVEDHPVEFIYDSLSPRLYSSGSVYEVYRWPSRNTYNDPPDNTDPDFLTGFFIFDGSGFDKKSDMTALVGKNAGSYRFSMNAAIWVTSWKDPFKYGTTGGWNEPQGTYVTNPDIPSDAYDDMIVANMSTQRQFDVVEVESDTVRLEGADLITPSGNVAVYDLTNDPEQFKAAGDQGNFAYHTATLSASHDFFDTTADVDRFILGNLVDGWVLMKINGNSMATDAVEVDVYNSIPRDPLTDDLMNNGTFTQFRMGAWYTDNYPAAVSYYEQRRVFAGTSSDPSMIWLSSLNDDTDFRPVEEDGQVLDTSGIAYKLGTSSTAIRWIQTGQTLIVGTDSNEWQLRPNEFSAAITPSNIRITQETSIGSDVQGLRIGSSIFFPHISGKQLSEFKFDFQTQQFVTDTVTKLVPDLFDNDPIVSMSYQFNPNSVIWIVTEKGKLYALTYRKEDDAYAWSEHSTRDGDTFKDVVVIPKGDSETSEDQVWFVVNRYDPAFAGFYFNSLERLSLSYSAEDNDHYKSETSFLDSYVRYPPQGSFGTPTITVSVPNRLIRTVEGSPVVALIADGVNYGDVELSGPGEVTIPGSSPGNMATDYILIGLPYTGKIRINPIAFQEPGSGNAYGQLKRIVSLRAYLYKSISFKLGLEEDLLELIDPDRTLTESGTKPLFTGFTEEYPIIDSQFEADQTPLIVQDKPYPLTLVSSILKTDKF